MYFEKVSIHLQGDLSFPLPPLHRVLQEFDQSQLSAPEKEASTRDALSFLKTENLSGKTIGITAGSRKIQNLEHILKTAVCILKDAGATPIIIPAMGSHGNATAEGQAKLLESLGITETALGAKIVSSMDTEQIGQIKDWPVFCSKTALQCDGIIVCGRIKPHTSIRGYVESGLSKMMVVGLGKHLGATMFHRQGYQNMASLLPKGARIFLDRLPVLCGLGIIENAYDQTALIEYVPIDHFIDQEHCLLEAARQKMPRFLLDEIDVLIVRQLGKEISGGGMDPNITGRSITPLPMTAPTPILTIVALNLTEASHGNATGIGGADIIPRHLLDTVDLESTYTNVLTSGALTAAKLPIVLPDDEAAIRTALSCAPRKHIDDVKIVYIQDTLHLGELWVSENYRTCAEKCSELRWTSDTRQLSFDASGNLIF